MTGRPAGFVRKPIICPGDGLEPCKTVTAVPVAGEMFLTAEAAGMYPHGFRCLVHRRKVDIFGNPVVGVLVQPDDAPRRLPKARMARAS